MSDSYPPGPNPKAKGSQKAAGRRVEAKESTGRTGSGDIQRQGSEEKRITVQSGELRCFYINARNLISKIDNLEAWVSDLAPDIIGVTESWANCDIRDSELALEGYDLFRKDRPVDRAGGGVLLYVKSRLHAVEVAPFSSFPEQVWCYFLDANNIKCHIGVCYRTPTVDIYGSHNHDLVRDILDKLHSSQKHFLLMGDFNYRFTTWPPLHSDHNITVDSSELANCLDDNFFTQHVDFPTRNNAILDLVISDEPHMASELTDLDLFPGSDHKALSWKL